MILDYFLNLFKIYSGFEGRYWLGMSGSLVEKLNFQAVIKSAASAASPTDWELHMGAPGRRLRLAGDGFVATPKPSGRLH